jgi:hypothetical protein
MSHQPAAAVAPITKEVHSDYESEDDVDQSVSTKSMPKSKSKPVDGSKAPVSAAPAKTDLYHEREKDSCDPPLTIEQVVKVLRKVISPKSFHLSTLADSKSQQAILAPPTEWSAEPLMQCDFIGFVDASENDVIRSTIINRSPVVIVTERTCAAQFEQAFEINLDEINFDKHRQWMRSSRCGEPRDQRINSGAEWNKLKHSIEEPPAAGSCRIRRETRAIHDKNVELQIAQQTQSSQPTLKPSSRFELAGVNDRIVDVDNRRLRTIRRMPIAFSDAPVPLMPQLPMTYTQAAAADAPTDAQHHHLAPMNMSLEELNQLELVGVSAPLLSINSAANQSGGMTRSPINADMIIAPVVGSIDVLIVCDPVPYEKLLQETLHNTAIAESLDVIREARLDNNEEAEGDATSTAAARIVRLVKIGTMAPGSVAQVHDACPSALHHYFDKATLVKAKVEFVEATVDVGQFIIVTGGLPYQWLSREDGVTKVVESSLMSTDMLLRGAPERCADLLLALIYSYPAAESNEDAASPSDWGVDPTECAGWIPFIKFIMTAVRDDMTKLSKNPDDADIAITYNDVFRHPNLTHTVDIGVIPSINLFLQTLQRVNNLDVGMRVLLGSPSEELFKTLPDKPQLMSSDDFHKTLSEFISNRNQVRATSSVDVTRRCPSSMPLTLCQCHYL